MIQRERVWVAATGSGVFSADPEGWRHCLGWRLRTKFWTTVTEDRQRCDLWNNAIVVNVRLGMVRSWQLLRTEQTPRTSTRDVSISTKLLAIWKPQSQTTSPLFSTYSLLCYVCPMSAIWPEFGTFQPEVTSEHSLSMHSAEIEVNSPSHYWYYHCHKLLTTYANSVYSRIGISFDSRRESTHIWTLFLHWQHFSGIVGYNHDTPAYFNLGAGKQNSHRVSNTPAKSFHSYRLVRTHRYRTHWLLGGALWKPLNQWGLAIGFTSIMGQSVFSVFLGSLQFTRFKLWSMKFF